MHCLREISIQEYENVKFYFEKICELTGKATKSKSSRVGAQAFEFWTSMAEEETERNKKGTSQDYIASTQNQLLELVLEGLKVITFEEDEDDDEWGHALSAACCLQKMALLMGNYVLQPVVEFVAAHI